MMKRILLVEYATSTIEIIKELFAHPIFHLTVVNEGDAAKKELSENHFDILITAAMLPKFHGFNLSEHTARHYPNTRIIIISDIYKGMNYRHQAITQYLADDFFEKPFDKEKFKERVFQLLEISEHDLVAPTPKPTTKVIAQDTNKIPTLDLLQAEGKQMSSEDLFGDIIEAVQDGQSTYEIKLTEEHDPTKQFPIPPAITQPMPQVAVKVETAPPPPPPKKAPVLDPFTQRLNVEEIQREITSRETKPEEIYKPTPDTFKTLQMPMATQVLKQQPASAVTQKIDLGLLDLIKQENEEKEKAKAKQKNKKIEDDISRKFEETLSGLGLSTPGKPAKPGTPPPPPAPTPRPLVEEPVKKTELLTAYHTPPATITSATPSNTPQVSEAKPIPPIEKKSNTDEIGGYEILSLIARGGMAEIYKAKKTGVKGFEKMVALKKILPGYGADAKYIEMFVDEAKIAAQLSHPNIVQIYDLGKKDDYYFIAMEYVAGKDLRHILHRLEDANMTMPEELAIYMTIKILEALSYAHSARDGEGRKLEIVHRDVSPPNILVSYSGNIKLTDFGVSKASIKLHHTVAGALKGKLLYMSPEQAQGDADIDYRSDIYSAGIILFELITGQKLFMGSSEIGILQKVQEGKIVRPRQFKRDITPHLEAIILKALEKDINQRFQKASDMIKALDAYMLKNFDNTPDTSHLAHFIYTLYKEEIIKDRIEINLKPLPYAIKRKPREIIPPRPETPRVEVQASNITPGAPASANPIPTPPKVVPAPVQAMPLTVPTRPAPVVPPTTVMPPKPTPAPPITPPPLYELTPKPEFKPAPPPPEPHFEPESDIIELSPADQITLPPPAPKIAEIVSTPVPDSVPHEEEEEFHPLIEINFDDEPMPVTKTESQPIASTKASGTFASQPVGPSSKTQASQSTLFAHYHTHAQDEQARKRKRMLFIFIAIIVILIAVIIYFWVTSSASNNQPAASDTGNVVSGLQSAPGTAGPNQTPAQTATETLNNTTSPVQAVTTTAPLPNATNTTNTNQPIPATTPTKQDPAKATSTIPADSEKKTTPETDKKADLTDKKNSKEKDIPAEASVTTDKNQVPATKVATPEDTPVQSQPAVESPKPEPKPEVNILKEGDTVALSEVDSEPIPISNPLSISLSIKRLMMSDQRVLVSFLVDHNGKVETVKLIQQSSMKKLNSSIVEAVQGWTFQPATKNNVRVKVWKNKWIVINK